MLISGFYVASTVKLYKSAIYFIFYSCLCQDLIFSCPIIFCNCLSLLAVSSPAFRVASLISEYCSVYEYYSIIAKWQAVYYEIQELI